MKDSGGTLADVNCASVLVVEDDIEISEAIKDILEMEGYEVSVAGNGLEALEKLKTVPHPCLILLDLMMPVMNGFEFLEHRRGDDILATIPVVIVSAAGDAKIQTVAADATRVIKKPIKLDLLLGWVREICPKPV